MGTAVRMLATSVLSVWRSMPFSVPCQSRWHWKQTVTRLILATS